MQDWALPVKLLPVRKTVFPNANANYGFSSQIDAALPDMQ